jgi:hypothetical protein
VIRQIQHKNNRSHGNSLLNRERLKQKMLLTRFNALQLRCSNIELNVCYNFMIIMQNYLPALITKKKKKKTGINSNCAGFCFKLAFQLLSLIVNKRLLMKICFSKSVRGIFCINLFRVIPLKHVLWYNCSHLNCNNWSQNTSN